MPYANRPIYWLSLLIALLLAGAAMAQEGVPITGESAAGLEAFDQFMVEELTSNHTPGGALALLRNGRPILLKGYGYADRAQAVVAGPDTPFALASLSKTITAMGILHLVETGKLGLDDTLFPFLPKGHKNDPRLRNITVRMLLNHSSGFARVMRASPDQEGEDPELNQALERQIELALARPLQYQPGSECVYSNFGYNLLGYIAAQASGQDYESFIRSQVFQPLAMSGPRLSANESHYPTGESRRYSPGGNLLPANLSPRSGPAGGWAASVRDLARLLGGLFGPNRYLSASMQAEMVAAPPPSLVRPDGSYFGLGWDKVQPVGQNFRCTKNGSLAGAYTQMGHEPSGVEYVLLFNGGDKKVAHQATRRIIQLIHQQRNWPSPL